jgi:RimJ/RimL family protein N-acetyltransferase
MQHQANQIGLFINSVSENELKEIHLHMNGHAMIDQCCTYWNHEFRCDETLFRKQATHVQSINTQIRDMTPDDLREPSLLERVLAKWGSIDHFFAKAFGVIAETEDKKLQGYCIAGAIGDGKVELSMKVLALYQSMGLGYRIGRVFLDRTKHRNLKPVWTCMKSNVASVKIAEKLGFQNRKIEPFLYWSK